jgi:hypothetical protein
VASASRIPSLVGQLIKLPVADPQCGSDVPRVLAVQDQALHSAVERRSGSVGFVLGMHQPLLGLPRLSQPLLIHLAHTSEGLRPNADDDARGCCNPGDHSGYVGRQLAICGTEEDRIMARSSGNAFFSNFSTYDAPFPTKVRLALANNWRKIRTGSSCCGNLGQPGC